MTDRRYYVTLSATCPEPLLHEVVDHLSAGMPSLTDALPGLESLSLSFAREDAGQYVTQTVALPVVPDGGGQHAADDLLPTAPVPTATDGTPR